LKKSPSTKTGSSGTVADQVAEFIGRTMGELLNRKDALTKQMADVDQQIAEVRQRVVRQFGEYVPAGAARSRVRKAAARVRAAGETVRAVSSETRRKMAAAARRRWARERAKKAKGGKSK
jgi:hypothetical protein